MNLRHPLRHRNPVDLAAVLIVVVVAAAAAAVVVLTPRHESTPQVASPAARSAASARPARAARPACSDVKVAADPVQCRRGKARVTVVAGRTPLMLPEVNARAFGAVARDGHLDVRLRFRNRTQSERVVNAGQGQVFLAVGGRRLPAQPAPAPLRVGPGLARTATLTFAEPRPRSGAQVEIQVLPFSQAGTRAPRRFGLIRLDVTS